jgi:hypothetical protein
MVSHGPARHRTYYAVVGRIMPSHTPNSFIATFLFQLDHLTFAGFAGVGAHI